MNYFDEIEIAKQSFAYADLTGTDKWITNWIPVRTGWTSVGTAVVTSRIRLVGRQLFGQVSVVPGTTEATTAGTSYIVCPLTAKGIGGQVIMFNATTNVSIGTGGIDVANSRIHVPTWAASGNTITIAFWYES